MDQESNPPSQTTDTSSQNQTEISPTPAINQLTGMVNQTIGEVVPSETREKLKDPFLKRLWVVFPYLLISSIFLWRSGFGLVSWWFGILIGFFILDVDHILDVYFIHHDTKSSQKIITAFKQKHWKELWKELLETASQRKRLILHSIIFEIVVAVLALYVVTSGNTYFGQALILSLFLRILSEQVREYMKNNNMNSWFWQIRDPVPSNLQSAFLTVGIVIWVIFNLALLR